MTKDEFFKKYYVAGLAVANTLDGIDDDMSDLYRVYDRYRQFSVQEFLEGEGLYTSEKEALEYMQWLIDNTLDQLTHAKEFIELRQKTLQEEA